MADGDVDKHVYDKIKGSWAKEHSRQFWAYEDINESNFYQHLRKFDLRGKSILDIGCGDGVMLDDIRQIEADAKFYGMDLTAQLIDIARERFPFATFSIGDLEERYPYETGSMDWVVSRHCLMYLKNIEKVHQEVYRVLKPDGRFLFKMLHPMKNYLDKKRTRTGGQSYFQKEAVVNNYGFGEFGETCQSHTLMTYLSPFILENYTIDLFKEEMRPDNVRLDKDDEYPSHVVIAATKR